MHCIDIIIIKKDELRNSKINTIIDNKDLRKDERLFSIELPQNMIAFPLLSADNVHEYIGPEVKFIRLITDYFGGGGDQGAGLYITHKQGYKTIKKMNGFNPINDALREYGLIKNKYDDEFDTINLGHYRSNSDFLLDHG